MTTEIINEKLLELNQELNKNLKLKHQYEKEYYQKYYKLLLNSPMTNMSKQEAEAKGIMFEDPIYNLYQDVRLEIKLLEIERETYIEIGRNLRSFERK